VESRGQCGGSGATGGWQVVPSFWEIFNGRRLLTLMLRETGASSIRRRITTNIIFVLDIYKLPTLRDTIDVSL